MKKLYLLLLFIFLSVSLLSANTLEQALNKAADSLSRSGKLNPKRHILSIEIVNFHSGQKDKTALKIETNLYFVLERYNFRTLLLREALAGSGHNTVYIKGTYEPQGETTILRLQAVKGMLTGEVLDQVAVHFYTEKVRRKTLVAVLDIDSKVLNDSQKKAFSDLFRAALDQVADFEQASSADVDKMNPDAIQEQTGCTRDECATIIGEQLGVDRAISTALFQISDTKFMLSSKIMDIRDGSILKLATVKYQGNIEDIDEALVQLAEKFSEQNGTDRRMASAEIPAEQDELKPEMEVTVYEEELIKWRISFWSTFFISAATSAYSYSQFLQAEEAYNSMEENKRAMKNATTYDEALRYQEHAEEDQEELEIYNDKMIGGAAIATLFAGLTFWVWLNEPEDPRQSQTINWFPVVGTNQVRLDFQYRW